MNDGTSANGQGTTVSPTADPVTTPVNDPTQPNPAAKDIKTDASKPVERKTIPYERFSDVTRKNGQLSTELKYKEQEIETLRKQLESNKGAMSSAQEQQVIDEIPEEIKEIFGDNAAQGKKLLDSYLKKQLDLELTNRQKEDLAKKIEEEQNLSTSEAWVKTETQRLVESSPDLDVNKFHKFIQDTADAEGEGFFKNGKLNFDLYFKLYKAENPVAPKAPTGLEKIAGKTVTKTDSTKVWGPKDFRR